MELSRELRATAQDAQTAAATHALIRAVGLHKLIA
jgi:hypothetical protein